MHEKKEKSCGGLEKRYRKEMDEITLNSISMALDINTIAEDVLRDDTLLSDLQTDWLNEPYLLMKEIECQVAELEAKVSNDPKFSDLHKRRFAQEYIDPVKGELHRAHIMDDYVMNGIMPPEAWG